MEASVTLLEATTPVKLPTTRCPLYLGLDPRQEKGRISTMAPRFLAKPLQCLRPILHVPCPGTTRSCSKGSRGLSVPSRVPGIFTGTTISPSSWSRQCPDRYTIRAGRNLPDKEFRYLRTRYSYGRRLLGLRSGASLSITPSINLPAPGRHHTLYVHFRVCRVLCF